MLYVVLAVLCSAVSKKRIIKTKDFVEIISDEPEFGLEKSALFLVLID